MIHRSDDLISILKKPAQDDNSVSESEVSANGSGSGSAVSGSAGGSGSCGSTCASAMSVPSALRKGRYSSSPTNVQSKHHRSILDEDKKAGEKSEGKTVVVNVVPSSVRACKNKNLDTREEFPAYVSLPNGLVIGDSGLILGRSSRRSLFFKKSWREFVWVHCKPVTILVFRSTGDARKWMNAKYLRKNEKKRLIKHSIDFDAMNLLGENNEGSERCDRGSPSVMKFIMNDVRTKRATIDGSIRHQFQIEKWSRVGTRVEVAFASSDVMEVKNIRKAIRKCIKRVSKPKKEKRSCGDEETDVSVLNSVLSDATGTTLVSNSTYHISSIDSGTSNRRSTRKHRGPRNRAVI